MGRYPRVPLGQSNHKGNEEEEEDTNGELVGKQNARRRSLIAPFHHRNSSMSVSTLSDVAKQALYKNRRSSWNDVQCLPLGIGNWDYRPQPHFFDSGKNKNDAPSVSRVSLSSGRALLRSALGSLKANGEEGRVSDHHKNEKAESKPILTFRGGGAWKYLEIDREDLYLDLFWPAKKENPFHPEVMPLEGLAPLCNFRNLTFLKLTGMMRSYQKYIWQAVWLNPGLEVLELEMALEPCIRRTFNAGWPSIKGDWGYDIADKADYGYQVPYIYADELIDPPFCVSGDDGEGTLERRIGIGEYLDKEAIAQARYRATMVGCSLRQLPVVELSLTGFVVDAGPFFEWFNPHRLRMINFKNDCVDAGFALPNHMAQHVVVTWPPRVAEYAQYARMIRPGEVKLLELGTSARDGGNEGKKNQRNKRAPRKIKRRAASVDIMDVPQQNGQATAALPRPGLNKSFNLFSVGRGFWKN